MNMGFKKFLIIGFFSLFSFLILTQPVFAIPAMQQRCEPSTECIIGEYVFDNNGYTPITTDNYCQITITDPSDVAVVSNSNIPDKNDGWHYYSTSTLSAEGLYRSTICCGTAPERLCIDKTFVVGTSFNNLAEKVWSYTGTALDTANNAIAKVWSYATRKLTSRQIGSGSEYMAGVATSTTVAQVANEADQTTVKYNVELVRKATFDFAGIADAGSSSSTLVDSELTQPDNYWQDYNLIMMSGNNIGQSRTVASSSYSGNSITPSSPFTYAIAAGDQYVVQHETRLIARIWTATTRTLTSFGTLVADIWSNSTRTLTGFGSLAADVWNVTTRRLTTSTLDAGSLATLANLNSLETNIRGASSTDLTTLAGYVDSVEGYIGIPTDTATTTLFGAVRDVRTKLNQLDTLETKIDTVDTIVDLIRASQLLGYKLQLSDAGEVLETKNYRAKLTVLNYESNLVDASSTPTIILYDALRATATSTTMTKLSTGVYEFVYTVASGAANGVWEALVSVNLGGSLPVQLNDYFEVEGSPAQVVINSMSDTTIPTISANTTISNEGSVGYEYQYEYCVVTTQDNQCGGGDDTAYASAAKYLTAGQNWTTDLSLTVPNIGAYWFKVVVYWGTETSGASRTFTTTEEAALPVAVGAGAGAAVCGATATLSDILCKLLEIQKELGYFGKPTADIGASAYQTLRALSSALKSIGGTKGYNLDSLYEVSSIGATDLIYLKNKSLEMKALLDVNKILIDKAANKPVIKTWFEWGSVILKMLIVNPSDSQTQIVPFKAYLPREVKPEHIIDREDLALDFDEENNLWYVHKEIKLGAGQSATKKVEIKDIWAIPIEDLNSSRRQFEELLKPLEGTAFFAQAVTLKSDADRLLDGIIRKQNEYKATPQEHIVAYRENMESLKAVDSNLEALKKLVAEESGAGRALGSLFGVSTTMTWAIVIIVVVGIMVLMVMLYTMLLRHQDLEYHLAGETGIQKHPRRGLRGLLVKQMSEAGIRPPKVILKVIIKFLIIIGILALAVWLLIKFIPGL